MPLRRCLTALLLAGLAGAAFAASVTVPDETGPAVRNAALAQDPWYRWCQIEPMPGLGTDLCALWRTPR